MKVLFLDFDGVLNSQPFLKEAAKARREARNQIEEQELFLHMPEERWESMIDPAAVERLNAVIDRTGCKVVVSSSWRLLNTPVQLTSYLRNRGYRYKVLDRTPNSRKYGEVRGHEIQKWIDDWNASHHVREHVTAFAILDDDSDMAHLMDRLVHTSFTAGLQDEHVEQLVSLLGEDPA